VPSFRSLELRRSDSLGERLWHLGIVSLADLAREAKAKPGTAALALLGETLANITRPGLRAPQVATLIWRFAGGSDIQY
jgi:hypothetical protein